MRNFCGGLPTIGRLPALTVAGYCLCSLDDLTKQTPFHGIVERSLASAVLGTKERKGRGVLDTREIDSVGASVRSEILQNKVFVRSFLLKISFDKAFKFGF